MEILNVLGQWLSETYQYILTGVGLLLASGSAYVATVVTLGKKLLPISNKVDNSVSQSEFNDLKSKVDLLVEMQKDNTQATLEINTLLSPEQRSKLESNIQKANNVLPTFVNSVLKNHQPKY